MTFLFPQEVYTVHTKLLFSRHKNSTEGSARCVWGAHSDSPSYSYPKSQTSYPI